MYIKEYFSFEFNSVNTIRKLFSEPSAPFLNVSVLGFQYYNLVWVTGAQISFPELAEFSVSGDQMLNSSGWFKNQVQEFLVPVWLWTCVRDKIMDEMNKFSKANQIWLCF